MCVKFLKSIVQLVVTLSNRNLCFTGSLLGKADPPTLVLERVVCTKRRKIQMTHQKGQRMSPELPGQSVAHQPHTAALLYRPISLHLFLLCLTCS